MKRTIIAAVALAGAVFADAPASAAGPAVGSACQSGELGQMATASDGTTVRCLAHEQGGSSWLPAKGAADTIAQLQQEGYTVTIDRVGDGPLDQCRVTSVRSPTTIIQSYRTSDDLVVIEVSKTIHISLNCTPE